MVDKACIYLYPSVPAYASLYQFCKKHVDYTTITPPTTTYATTAAVERSSESVYTTYTASADAHVDDEIEDEVEEGSLGHAVPEQEEVVEEEAAEVEKGGDDSDEELDRMNQMYGRVGLGQRTDDTTGTQASYSSYDPLYISKISLPAHTSTPTSSSGPSSTTATIPATTTAAVRSAFDRGISLPPSHPKPSVSGLKSGSRTSKSTTTSSANINEKKLNKNISTHDSSTTITTTAKPTTSTNTTTAAATVASCKYNDNTSNIQVVLAVKKEDLIKSIISKLTTYNAILAPDGTLPQGYIYYSNRVYSM